MLTETYLTLLNTKHRLLMPLLQNPARDRKQRAEDLTMIHQFIEVLPKNLRLFPLVFMQLSYYLYKGYQYDFEHLCKSVREERVSLEEFRQEMTTLQSILTCLMGRQRKMISGNMCLTLDLSTFECYLEMMIDLETEVVSRVDVDELVMSEDTIKRLSNGRYYFPGSPGGLYNAVNVYAYVYPKTKTSLLMTLLRLNRQYSFPLSTADCGMSLFSPIMNMTLFNREFIELCDVYAPIALSAYTKLSTSEEPRSLDIAFRALSRIMRKFFGERNRNIDVTPESCLVLAKHLAFEYTTIEWSLDEYQREHLSTLRQMISILDDKIECLSNNATRLTRGQ